MSTFVRSFDIEHCLFAQSLVSLSLCGWVWPSFRNFIDVYFCYCRCQKFRCCCIWFEHQWMGKKPNRTCTNTRPNQNFKVFGNRFPQMLHEFGGNQKFFYQNKVHNFSFLLFKALRFFSGRFAGSFSARLFRPFCVILTFQVAVCMNGCYLPIGKRFVY